LAAKLTIMDPNAPNKRTKPDPVALLLGALAWICGDDDRAGRLLALTGMDGNDLRARATDPIILAATGEFLADHEPDLIACAEALDCTPAALVAAAREVAAQAGGRDDEGADEWEPDFDEG
jgi:hypothetical protein